MFRRSSAASLALLLLLLFSANAASQTDVIDHASQEWQQAMERGTAALRTREYDKAIYHFSSAVRLSANGTEPHPTQPSVKVPTFNPSLYALSMHSAGLVFYEKHEFARAASYFEPAYKKLQEAELPPHDDVTRVPAEYEHAVLTQLIANDLATAYEKLPGEASKRSSISYYHIAINAYERAENLASGFDLTNPNLKDLHGKHLAHPDLAPHTITTIYQRILEIHLANNDYQALAAVAESKVAFLITMPDRLSARAVDEKQINAAVALSYANVSSVRGRAALKQYDLLQAETYLGHAYEAYHRFSTLFMRSRPNIRTLTLHQTYQQTLHALAELHGRQHGADGSETSREKQISFLEEASVHLRRLGQLGAYEQILDKLIAADAYELPIAYLEEQEAAVRQEQKMLRQAKDEMILDINMRLAQVLINHASLRQRAYESAGAPRASRSEEREILSRLREGRDLLQPIILLYLEAIGEYQEESVLSPIANQLDHLFVVFATATANLGGILSSPLGQESFLSLISFQQEFQSMFEALHSEATDESPGRKTPTKSPSTKFLGRSFVHYAGLVFTYCRDIEEQGNYAAIDHAMGFYYSAQSSLHKYLPEQESLNAIFEAHALPLRIERIDSEEALSAAASIESTLRDKLSSILNEPSGSKSAIPYYVQRLISAYAENLTTYVDLLRDRNDVEVEIDLRQRHTPLLQRLAPHAPIWGRSRDQISSLLHRPPSNETTNGDE